MSLFLCNFVGLRKLAGALRAPMIHFSNLRSVLRVSAPPREMISGNDGDG
jgi:hypothetical protein